MIANSSRRRPPLFPLLLPVLFFPLWFGTVMAFSRVMAAEDARSNERRSRLTSIDAKIDEATKSTERMQTIALYECGALATLVAGSIGFGAWLLDDAK